MQARAEAGGASMGRGGVRRCNPSQRFRVVADMLIRQPRRCREAASVTLWLPTVALSLVYANRRPAPPG